MRPPSATIVLPQLAYLQNGSGTRRRRYDSIGANGYNTEDAGEACESMARGGALAARTFASHSNSGRLGNARLSRADVSCSPRGVSTCPPGRPIQVFIPPHGK